MLLSSQNEIDIFICMENMKMLRSQPGVLCISSSFPPRSVGRGGVHIGTASVWSLRRHTGHPSHLHGLKAFGGEEAPVQHLAWCGTATPAGGVRRTHLPTPASISASLSSMQGSEDPGAVIGMRPEYTRPGHCWASGPGPMALLRPEQWVFYGKAVHEDT